MFRPSSPDHVLALTEKILGKPHRKWVKFVQIQILHMAKKVKLKGTINSKNLRDCFFRDMAVPLLLVLGPLLAEISLLLYNSASSLFSRAGQAPRTWGRPVALLVGKMVLVGLERRPSFLLTKTRLMATTRKKEKCQVMTLLCSKIWQQVHT